MNNFCVIIPCYNEESRLPFTEFREYINNSDLHFCFVNDGSTDKTIKVLTNLQAADESKVHVLDLTQNVGKAEAVRQGINYILDKYSYQYVGFLDADLATPICELETLYKAFNYSEKLEFVFGSRVKLLGRNVERTALRHYFGRVFATAASTILNLPVYDTQCGAKVIKRDLAQELFKDKFISPWLFDIELFARCIKMHGRKTAVLMLLEVPLFQWLEKGDSRIKPRHLARVPIELIKIFSKYRLNN